MLIKLQRSLRRWVIKGQGLWLGLMAGSGALIMGQGCTGSGS